MTEPSSRDLEQISAYLDGQLSGADAARLESRIKADPELRSVYNGLRQTRSLLRQLPARRAPRNFMLTPQMAGITAARPRVFPFFRLASVLATILLFLGYAVNLSASRVNVGISVASMPAVPTQEAMAFDTYAAPAADEAPTDEMIAAEPTAEIASKMMPTQTVEGTPQANIVAPTVASTESAMMLEPGATLDESSMNSAAGTTMMQESTEEPLRIMPYQPEPQPLPVPPLWLYGLLAVAAFTGAGAFIVDKRVSRAKLTTKEIVLIVFALLVAVLLAVGIYWMLLPQ